MAAEKKKEYPELPRGITSFGAAVVDDWLYVYGGHFGSAHRYSTKSQSNELSRLNLAKPDQWEVVATGPRLQGLAMVAHGGKLYRVGGFTAHNEEGAEHDLASVTDFARFDPKTKKWESLPPMPTSRSSHDAVVIGDRLYVAGGWALDDDDEDDGDWHDTALVVDLAREPLKWEQLPKPPFKRRALSLGHLDGKLYVIGGMQKEGGPTTKVDVFDPETNKWSKGPALSGEGMEGFGSSAFTVADKLYTSTYAGNLQSLAESEKPWRIASKLREDRFFHRMLPYRDRLILVGGASMEEGKRLGLETVELSDLK